MRAERAEARLRHQTLVFAEAEHKLKTSLAVISGWAITLDERWDDVDEAHRREGVAAIRRSAEALGRQARVLLEEARADIAALDLEPVGLDLADILRATTPSFAAMGAAHEIRCDLDGPVPVWADSGALQEVLGHLVENAVKYSPDGGVVRLGARADGRWAELVVTDEGVGIPDHVDLFAAFTQGSKGDSDGIGLGLYIVHTLVEAMGGSVAAARNPGPGSTFTVRLPATGPAPSPSSVLED